MSKYIKENNKIYEVQKREVDLIALKSVITDLDAQIANTPQKKTKPDQETLDFWNEETKARYDIESLEKRRVEKQALYNKIEKVWQS